MIRHQIHETFSFISWGKPRAVKGNVNIPETTRQASCWNERKRFSSMQNYVEWPSKWVTISVNGSRQTDINRKHDRNVDAELKSIFAWKEEQSSLPRKIDSAGKQYMSTTTASSVDLWINQHKYLRENDSWCTDFTTIEHAHNTRSENINSNKIGLPYGLPKNFLSSTVCHTWYSARTFVFLQTASEYGEAVRSN